MTPAPPPDDPALPLELRRSPLDLVQLTDASLRVRAIEAARDYDVAQLTALIEAYLLGASRKGARGSARTREAYALAVRQFVPWAHEAGVNLLRPGRRDGGRFLLHLQTRPNGAKGRRGPLSASTVALYLAGGRALYRALRWAGATQAQPFEDVHAAPDPTPGIVKRPPYQAELETVLSATTDLRVRALLLLCAHAGLRIAEALAARPEDLRGTALTVRGKGGKQRVVPLSARTREALAALSPGPESTFVPWTYRQATYRLQLSFRAAGCGHLWRGFHAARKHSGTRLYQLTRDFTRVSLFLGHSSVDTTRRYVAVSDHDLAAEVEHL